MEKTIHMKNKDVPQSFIDLATKIQKRGNGRKQKELIIRFIEECSNNRAQPIEKFALGEGKFLTIFDKSVIK